MGERNGETGMAARIERKLTEALTPLRVRIVDESHKHAGHSGWQPGGETHFRVEIVADAFVGQSRVARQRLVYQALSEELEERVHALTLRTFTPDEDSRQH
ncbi:MAG: BolA family protein [Kiloniellales bacterium]